MEETTIIQTEKSFLKEYKIEEIEPFITQALQEIQGKLLERPEIKIFGKIAHQRRNVGFFSDESIGYHYSNYLAKSIPMTENLKKILDIINTTFKTQFNGILINEYENGEDYIGAHSDDEKNLDPAGVLAISVGAVRKFRIRDKHSRKIVMDIPTENYKILHMGGEFQKEFLHEIPVEKRIKEKRISFTFRKHRT